MLPSDHWGETRNKEGVNRRITLIGVPEKCTARDISEKFGRENLEGVSFNRKSRLCFVQFKRPIDYTRAVGTRNLTFHETIIKIRPYRNDSPPPSRRESSYKTSSKYLRLSSRSPPRKRHASVERESHDRSGSSKEPNDGDRSSYNDWGQAPDYERSRSERYRLGSGSRTETSRYASSNEQDTGGDERGAQTPTLPISNAELWVEKCPSEVSPSHHLKLAHYGSGSNLTNHIFGKQTSNLSLQLPLPDQQQPPTLGIKLDPDTYYCSTSGQQQQEQQLALKPLANNYLAGGTSGQQLALPTTLRDPVESFLRLILTQQTARGLSVVAINLIQDYLESEKQHILAPPPRASPPESPQAGEKEQTKDASSKPPGSVQDYLNDPNVVRLREFFKTGGK